MNEKISTLAINKVRLMVRLGCEADERAMPQPIDVDVALFFREPPPACQTDQLDKTICYADLCQLLDQTCEGKEFKLIENLAFCFYSKLKDFLADSAKIAIWVRVHKLHPPILQQTAGASFCYGDWQPGAF